MIGTIRTVFRGLLHLSRLALYVATAWLGMLIMFNPGVRKEHDSYLMFTILVIYMVGDSIADAIKSIRIQVTNNSRGN